MNEPKLTHAEIKGRIYAEAVFDAHVRVECALWELANPRMSPGRHASCSDD